MRWWYDKNKRYASSITPSSIVSDCIHDNNVYVLCKTAYLNTVVVLNSDIHACKYSLSNIARVYLET
jgi:hypothetical protein